MDLSIVVPVHNEADNIVSLIDEIEHSLNNHCDYEIIYIDDGSTDDTLSILTTSKNEHPRLRVLSHLGCFGQSAAILTGVRVAKADWVATLDGDGQNDPADIPRLYDLCIKHASDSSVQMVAGQRKKRRDNWLKRISSRIANKVRGSLLKDNITDTGCGLKIVSRSVFLNLPFFDHIHRFLPAMIKRNDGDVITIDVNHRPRTRGKSKYGLHNRLWVGIVDIFGVMWLQHRKQLPVFEEK